MTRARPATLAPGSQALALSASALAEVVGTGCTAEEALLRVAPPPAQRAAVRAILAGSLRWYLRFAPAIDALLSQPGRRPQVRLHALLVAAAHQALYSRAPAQSVVNIAVDAARALGHGAASGFVNAVLRRLLRESTELFAAIDADPAAASAHPAWLVACLNHTYGAEGRAILAANNEHPPMALRVDLSRTTRAEYLEMLKAAGLGGVPGFVPSAVILAEPVPIERLPGFAEGVASVQDAGAQLAAYLLDAQPGQRVLDACAAPGGKCGHILEHTPGLGELVAVDCLSARLERVAENLRRMRRSATLVNADLCAPPAWWDGRPFDRILLDAPCSATGVIRRHPDIKLLRRQSDIPALAETQLQLLRQCIKMLRPGGRLLYVTCSVLPAENREVVDRLLADSPAPLRLETVSPFALPRTARGVDGDLQLIPRPASEGAEAATDGFYYACLNSTP